MKNTIILIIGIIAATVITFGLSFIVPGHWMDFLPLGVGIIVGNMVGNAFRTGKLLA